jgi:hypothetical protein
VSGVDDAYRRYIYLTDALARPHRSSISAPLSEENLRLGLIEAGDRRREAETKIESRLSETRERVLTLSLLDMCMAFETECRSRIPTAVGEAERVVRKHYGVRIMAQFKSQLLRRPDDFGSLDALFKIVEQHVSGPASERLSRLRKQRNRAAHGQSRTQEDDVTLEEARDLLNSVLDLLS